MIRGELCNGKMQKIIIVSGRESVSIVPIERKVEIKSKVPICTTIQKQNKVGVDTVDLTSGRKKGGIEYVSAIF